MAPAASFGVRAVHEWGTNTRILPSLRVCVNDGREDEVRQEEKRGERLIRVFVVDSWTAWVHSDEVETGL